MKFNRSVIVILDGFTDLHLFSESSVISYTLTLNTLWIQDSKQTLELTKHEKQYYENTRDFLCLFMIVIIPVECVVLRIFSVVVDHRGTVYLECLLGAHLVHNCLCFQSQPNNTK